MKNTRDFRVLIIKYYFNLVYSESAVYTYIFNYSSTYKSITAL